MLCVIFHDKHMTFHAYSFFQIFTFFRERRREGERGGEKHQCVVASCAPHTGDLAHNLSMCPEWELNQQPFVCRQVLNPLSHTSQVPISILFHLVSCLLTLPSHYLSCFTSYFFKVYSMWRHEYMNLLLISFSCLLFTPTQNTS